MHFPQALALALVLSTLILGDLHAQPASPELDIQFAVPDQLMLDWETVQDASCYDVIEQRPQFSNWWLGRLSGNHLDLKPWPQTNTGNQVRTYFVTALDDCDTYPFPDNPIAYYPLDGDTQDASGNGLHLNPAGGSWVDGVDGQAVHLNGVNEYLSHGSHSLFSPGSDGWTVSAWVLPDTLAGSRSVVSWYRCGANPSCYAPDAANYGLYCVAGQPSWGVRDDDSVAEAVSLGEEIPTGDWTLLTGTLDPVDRHIRLYVNGNLVQEGVEVFYSLNAGPIAVPFSVGRVYRTGWAEPHSYFNGSIDELRVYDRALSLEEVRALFLSGGWPN